MKLLLIEGYGVIKQIHNGKKVPNYHKEIAMMGIYFVSFCEFSLLLT